MNTDLPTKQIQHDLCDICVLSGEHGQYGTQL